MIIYLTKRHIKPIKGTRSRGYFQPKRESEFVNFDTIYRNIKKPNLIISIRGNKIRSIGSIHSTRERSFSSDKYSLICQVDVNKLEYIHKEVEKNSILGKYIKELYPRGSKPDKRLSSKISE